MILIGLCGLAGAGKNAVAEHLVVHHGFDVMAFAEPLYEALSILFDIPVEELEDRSRKEHPIDWLGRSPRELLQELGTGFGRERVHQDVWVLVAERRLEALRKLNGAQRVVFTDTRFANEADWLLRHGGVLWEIYGRHAPGVRPHVSEHGIPPTFTRRSIWNGGAWADTARQVDAALATDMEFTQ
jgi:hypothetical protein